ncbi:hypothetical protein, partial [Vibrio parahaemolyticus]|uniref:hypothetical protein n=1 Tax=Vibrio parahaemolyticus TaxID=670 RepID=UPI002E7B6FCF
NAQLSSEQRNTKATALRHKRKNHCKPKLPRVANLLELFVMRFVRKRQIGRRKHYLKHEKLQTRR